MDQPTNQFFVLVLARALALALAFLCLDIRPVAIGGGTMSTESLEQHKDSTQSAEGTVPTTSLITIIIII